MELCNTTKIEEWKIKYIRNFRRFQELPQENTRKNENQVSIEPNTEAHIKYSKAEVTKNDLKISKRNNEHLNCPETSENTYSSNMKSSTSIALEPVKRKGSKERQLVKSVSPVCGRNGCYFHNKQSSVSKL
ncbi:hypothetical protein O181_094808 [Austropuccinia psidii MF-1]|uniref:Uncharacterized protein n=1 Tax=Austropuccinia psidii MF-1 TaxID=1389203 RepID=A0A9Q3PAL2_9BASI|nr:hypothetical protein [Austropuccinia psidii MF-1]